jgi:hypothetical protein
MRVLAKFGKNNNEVRVAKFTQSPEENPRDYLDIREFRKEKEEFKAGKGVTIPLEELSALYIAVKQAEEYREGGQPFPENQILATLPKGKLAIIVALRCYQKKEYLDIRQMYDKAGEWAPTQKGITIPPDSIPSLQEALEDVTAVLLKEAGR